MMHCVQENDGDEPELYCVFHPCAGRSSERTHAPVQRETT